MLERLRSLIGKAALIVWYDAYDDTSWTDLETPPEPHVIRSLGWVHSVENGYVRLVYAYDATNAGTGSSHNIPVSMVQEIHEYRPYRPRTRRSASAESAAGGDG